jgi:23S rRNA pseudouridine955/2504/2580 synthase
MAKLPENASNKSAARSQSGGGRASDERSLVHRARTVEIDDEAGQRIDNFLLSQLGNVPKSRVYRMLRSGEVRVNGGRKKPVYRLSAGDRVRIPPYRAGPQSPASFISDTTLAELEKAIVFEDESLLAINKPAGLAVHGGSGVSFGLIEAIRRLRGDTVELVHRLDRDTSGCLLLAKRRPALRTLHDLIRAGQLQKRYRLIVNGRWPRDLTSVRLPLRKFHTASGERRVRVSADGKACHTDFQVVESCERASLLNAELITGRTHQIRVHAQASGHSLVGDRKYASDQELELAERLGIDRLCLHAERLELSWQGERLVLVAPLPEGLMAAWKALSRDQGQSA